MYSHLDKYLNKICPLLYQMQKLVWLHYSLWSYYWLQKMLHISDKYRQKMPALLLSHQWPTKRPIGISFFASCFIFHHTDFQLLITISVHWQNDLTRSGHKCVFDSGHSATIFRARYFVSNSLILISVVIKLKL